MVEGKPSASTQAEGDEHHEGRFDLLLQGGATRTRVSKHVIHIVPRKEYIEDIPCELGLSQRKEAPSPTAQTRRKGGPEAQLVSPTDKIIQQVRWDTRQPARSS